MKKYIDAEAFKEYCRTGMATARNQFRSSSMRAMAEDITEALCRDIDDQPAVDAIPVEWIRQRAGEYPGMESAMWDKLLRIWDKEKMYK